MAQNTRVRASNPSGVAAPLKPHYSNCVRVDSGPLLFISGQIATDEKGTIVGLKDMRAQAEQVLKNIQAILSSHGAAMSDVLNVNVYVTDIAAFHSIADIRLRYFPNNGPASTIVEVSNLALPELLVEISAIAAVQ
jgi:2-iminobutanoate/2-iminopropanoate deaminase